MMRTLAAGFLGLCTLSTGGAIGAAPTAVASFHCLGLYWKPLDAAGRPVGSSTNLCRVEYRVAGTESWRAALPLWFDPNDDLPDVSKDAAREREYRGSIVDLQPATTYEVRLTLQSPPHATVQFAAATRDENFRIKKTILVSGGTTREPLITSEGGSEQEGYVLYTAPAGQRTAIEVGPEADAGVRIVHSWVIVRSLTVRGGRQHGVVLGPVSDVVIERCDISDWGSWMPLPGGGESKIGWDGQAGIFSASSRLHGIVIQRNRIHDPHTRANSWGTSYRIGERGGPANGSRGTHHPTGPNAIVLMGDDAGDRDRNGTAGRHVIRYNEIGSTDGLGDVDHPLAGHGFNDGLGSPRGNLGYAGFPGPDSDIYGNIIANCWDDGIEAEGGGMNVRIWGNFIEHVFQGIAHAGNSLGPLYAFRNLVGFTRRDPRDPAVTHDDVSIRSATVYPDRGGLFKLGNSNPGPPRPPAFTSGRIYLFHNTSLQPRYRPIAARQSDRPAGPVWGIGSGGGRPLRELVSRNNLLHVQNGARENAAIILSNDDPTIDLDFDLASTGFKRVASRHERNGVRGIPLYRAGSAPRSPEQSPHSPGYNAAQVLANFSDHFNLGGAPDIGAVETGLPAMPFGVEADWTAFLTATQAR